MKNLGGVELTRSPFDELMNVEHKLVGPRIG